MSIKFCGMRRSNQIVKELTRASNNIQDELSIVESYPLEKEASEVWDHPRLPPDLFLVIDSIEGCKYLESGLDKGIDYSKLLIDLSEMGELNRIKRNCYGDSP